jgi:leucyl aminopeptidase (aminopeptidase T)
MRKLCLAGIVAIVFALPYLLADDPPKKDAKPDIDALAKKLITQSARVKEGDVVQISGGARDVELLESLNVEAAKLGADTLVILNAGDVTLKRLYLDVPAKYDKRTSTAALKLADTVTVVVNVDASDSDAALADVPPERVAAHADAYLPVYEHMLKRNVRQVFLGNGVYPTEARAKQYGISKAELAKLFYDGLNVDYDKMQARGKTLRDALTAGKKLHIATPGGTDLDLTIEERPVFISDGTISEDKIKKGGQACQVWLPAGEVYVTPVAGKAEGKVKVEHMLWEGKEVNDLTLTFEKGKMTKMTAKSGLDRIQSLFDAAGAGKDELAWVDIGINPAVKLPKSSPAALFQEAGTITIGVGNDVWAGGTNKSSFSLGCFLRGGTLTVDGKALVKDGTLE